MPHRHRLVGNHLQQRLPRRRRRVGRPSGEQREQDRTQCINAAVVSPDQSPPGCPALFRCRVTGRCPPPLRSGSRALWSDFTGRRPVRRCKLLRQAKVADLGDVARDRTVAVGDRNALLLSGRQQEHIGGLQVAVDNALFVGRLHTAGQQFRSSGRHLAAAAAFLAVCGGDCRLPRTNSSAINGQAWCSSPTA